MESRYLFVCLLFLLPLRGFAEEPPAHFELADPAPQYLDGVEVAYRTRSIVKKAPVLETGQIPTKAIWASGTKETYDLLVTRVLINLKIGETPLLVNVSTDEERVVVRHGAPLKRKEAGGVVLRRAMMHDYYFEGAKNTGLYLLSLPTEAGEDMALYLCPQRIPGPGESKSKLVAMPFEFLDGTATVHGKVEGEFTSSIGTSTVNASIATTANIPAPIQATDSSTTRYPLASALYRKRLEVLSDEAKVVPRWGIQGELSFISSAGDKKTTQHTSGVWMIRRPLPGPRDIMVRGRKIALAEDSECALILRSLQVRHHYEPALSKES